MSQAGPDAEAAGSGESNGQSRRSWRTSGLVAPIAFAAIAVAVGLAIVFAVLFLAIVSLHQRSLDARRSQPVQRTEQEWVAHFMEEFDAEEVPLHLSAGQSAPSGESAEEG